MRYFTKIARTKIIKGLKIHRGPSGPDSMGYYAELNGKFAGELHVQKPGNYATLLKVPEKMRRKGLGQALTENAMAFEGGLLPDPGHVSKKGQAFWSEMQKRHRTFKGQGIQLAYKPHSYV